MSSTSHSVIAEVEPLDIESIYKDAENGAPEDDEFNTDDASRLESRVDEGEEHSDEPASDADEETPTPRDWDSKPSVRDQAIKYPDSVRITDPITKVLNLDSPDDLKEFNRIQKKSSADDPSVCILEMERKFHEGRWSVYITYGVVQYQKL